MVDCPDNSCSKKCGEHDARWNTEVPEIRRDIEEINSGIISFKEDIENRRTIVDDRLHVLGNRSTSIEKAHNILLALLVSLVLFSGFGYFEAISVGKTLQAHINSDTEEFGSLKTHLSYHATKANQEDKQEAEIERLKESYTEVKVHFNIILDRLNSIERKM